MTTAKLEKQIHQIIHRYLTHENISIKREQLITNFITKEIASLIEQQKPKETDLKYRCNHCGFEWTHQDDYCPNCGEDNFDEVIEQQQSESGTAEEILAKLIYPETTTDWIKDAKDMGIPVFMALKAMESYAQQQCQKRDELIKTMGNYIKWLKTKPSMSDIAHAVYDKQIEQLKKGLPL